MIATIHKGKRSPPWAWLKLFPWIRHNVKSVSRKVVFHENCRYDLPGDEDDLDVNKIFGIGYLWDKKESARFGWNYNNVTGKVDLFAYYHVGGVRDFKKICEVEIGKEYLMILNIYEPSYSFAVWSVGDGLPCGDTMIPKTHKKTWSYNMGDFFGGTFPAPHDITIEIKKL